MKTEIEGHEWKVSKDGFIDIDFDIGVELTIGDLEAMIQELRCFYGWSCQICGTSPNRDTREYKIGGRCQKGCGMLTFGKMH